MATERPAMNPQKLARCMKEGKSRAVCMKEVYPERGGDKKPMPPGKGKGKKTSGKVPPQFARKGY